MLDPTFRGVWPALTTPFRSDLSLDPEGLVELADTIIGDGVHGIVVNGCTGESWSLTADERATVFRTAVAAARGRVKVIAGCSAQTAGETLTKIRQAQAAGCAYAMVSPPWYIMPRCRETLVCVKPVSSTIWLTDFSSWQMECMMRSRVGSDSSEK